MGAPESYLNHQVFELHEYTRRRYLLRFPSQHGFFEATSRKYETGLRSRKVLLVPKHVL